LPALAWLLLGGDQHTGPFQVFQGGGDRQGLVLPGPKQTAIAAGAQHNLVRRTDGTVWAWGYNSSGQLGNGTVELGAMPAQVSGLKGQAVAIGAGANNSMATLADGTTLAWGNNGSSQIGDGVSPVHTFPARVLLPCRFTGMPSEEHRASLPRECHEAP
jgi:YD repeat-containing protein